MVSVSFNYSILLVFLDIALALVYSVISLAVAIGRRRSLSGLAIALYLVQSLIAPVLLLLVGFILLLQGWRLDPALLFAFVLMHTLVIYLVIKDLIVYQSNP